MATIKVLAPAPAKPSGDRSPFTHQRELPRYDTSLGSIDPEDFQEQDYAQEAQMIEDEGEAFTLQEIGEKMDHHHDEPTASAPVTASTPKAQKALGELEKLSANPIVPQVPRRKRGRPLSERGAYIAARVEEGYSKSKATKMADELAAAGRVELAKSAYVPRSNKNETPAQTAVRRKAARNPKEAEEQVSLTLPISVVRWFKAQLTGGKKYGYQRKIADALQAFISQAEMVGAGA